MAGSSPPLNSSITRSWLSKPVPNAVRKIASTKLSRWRTGRFAVNAERISTHRAAAANLKSFHDATFAQDVIAFSSSIPVLVDAWAEWCGPCRMIAPVLEQLAAESNGKYKIAKLNVDENPRSSAQFNIRSIPTLLIFKNGKLVDSIVGVQPKQAIAARLAQAAS